MSASTITRATWTDDDGTGTTGTIIGNSRLQTDIYDKIDALLAGTGLYVTLGLGGALELAGRATPGVSTAGAGRIYFDSTANRFKISENAGAYKDMGAVTLYAPTLANVLNTVTKTTFVSFSVPSMADGDAIVISIAALVKNDTGSVQAPTWEVAYGSAVIGSLAGSNWAANATEAKVLFRFTFQRVGSDLWMHSGKDDLDSTFVSNMVSSGGVVGNTNVISAPTFTSAQTVALKLTLATASSVLYLKPQTANIAHFKV